MAQQKGISGGKLLILSLTSLYVSWEPKSHHPPSYEIMSAALHEKLGLQTSESRAEFQHTVSKSW